MTESPYLPGASLTSLTSLAREINPRVAEIINEMLAVVVELRAMRFEAGTPFEFGRVIGQEEVFSQIYPDIARTEIFPDNLVLCVLSPRLKSWQNSARIACVSARSARDADWAGYHEGKMLAYDHAIRLCERAFGLRRY